MAACCGKGSNPRYWFVAWLLVAGILSVKFWPGGDSPDQSTVSSFANPASYQEERPRDDDGPPRRIDTPDFPANLEWLNTKTPLKKEDLQGKFVLIDFWTYCCINCIHILPELKKLEKEFANELVVIGVHSAKFETEKDSKNIVEAILRYEIEHPVVNDSEMKFWSMYGANSWPTILLLDPEGKAIWGTRGETTFEDVAPVIKKYIPYYRKRKLLDEKPLRFELEKYSQTATPLRFPGKVLVDGNSERLFIADSNHNRIVVTSLDGKLLQTIGNGEIGNQDGDFKTAKFDHPQGMFLHEDRLFIADTENHTIRIADLKTRQVKTIAGTGKQSREAFPGTREFAKTGKRPDRWIGPPLETPLNSPWDLWVHNDYLYICNAGSHQIWFMPLDEEWIGPYAGNAREDIVDGELLPENPYELGYSSFAQPSGFASDGAVLFIADCEGSSIRAVPLDPKKEVSTVVGTNTLRRGRLFEFGDRDGEKEEVLLQHAMGVTYHDGKLYVADTYNNKIKVTEVATGKTTTLVGSGDAGKRDDQPSFDEPAGLCFHNGKLFVADTNNHAIRVVDVESKKVSTLTIEGLEPPRLKVERPDFSSANIENVDTLRLAPKDGKIRFDVELVFPDGWKLNDAAPMNYYLDIESKSRGETQKIANPISVKPAVTFPVELEIADDDELTVSISMNYFYCGEEGGVCKIDSVVWKAAVVIDSKAKTHRASLKHVVDP